MATQDFYRQLLDNINTALMLVDTGLRVTYVNSAAQVLLELSESRSVGALISELFPGQDDLVGELANTLQENNPHTNRDISLQSAGRNQQLRVDLVVTPLLEQPQPGLLLEFLPLDRILRITREEGLISSGQTSQALIRGLAHEIKNPLGGVLGAAQLLARQLDDAELQEYTGIIVAEAHRLRDLVDRLLGSHRQPEFRPLNIHEVLEHVYSLVRVEAGVELDLVRDYDPSLPQVNGDRAQLIQALLNVVRNAVQATQGNVGKKIIKLQSRIQRQFTIATRRHKLVCRLDISDNGVGVPAELVNSLFVPMVSGRADGIGLGLAISQSIINNHQGVIEYSREPGWTMFTLYIPVEDANGS